ncbi:hypothetical protein [Clostridium sp. Ade.TY]|uniref:hypothetical protein n=1 Tax=Clostridium sp. Ade.TY TaxID=1391647 RepID=UPI000408573F|nr:hypothetical protein [Clostridium sp. Ade.TY]
MKKSFWTKIIIAIVVVIIGLFAYSYISKTTNNSSNGNKTLTVTIKDASDNKTIIENEKFKTNANTLAEFLKENENTLGVKMENGQYGSFLLALKGVETKDKDKGPWWTYGYKSPSQNLDYKVGTAPVMDKINVHDGDSVEFVFTNTF